MRPSLRAVASLEELLFGRSVGEPFGRDRRVQRYPVAEHPFASSEPGGDGGEAWVGHRSPIRRSTVVGRHRAAQRGPHFIAGGDDVRREWSRCDRGYVLL